MKKMKVKLLIIYLVSIFMISCSSTYNINSITDHQWSPAKDTYVSTTEEIKIKNGRITISNSKIGVYITGAKPMVMNVISKNREKFEKSTIKSYEGLIGFEYTKILDMSQWGYVLLYSDLDIKTDRFRKLLIIKLQ